MFPALHSAQWLSEDCVILRYRPVFRIRISDPDSKLAQRIRIRVGNSDPVTYQDQAGENGPQKRKIMTTFNVWKAWTFFQGFEKTYVKKFLGKNFVIFK